MEFYLRVSIGIIALSIMACSQGFEENKPARAVPKAKLRDKDKSKVLFHGGMETSSTRAPGSPVLAALKNNHLGVSSTKTIGDAFDSYMYATKKEWRETPTINGTYYIDYICQIPVGPLSSAALKEGVVKRTLEIKFAIHEDGVTYIAMARRIEIRSDGMEHTIIIEPSDINKLVVAIYGNREITF